MAEVKFPSVSIKGLTDARKALKGTDLEGAVKDANKRAGELMAARIARGARSGTPQQQRLASTVRAAAQARAAKVMIGNVRNPFAMAAFMGGRARSGWYAQPKYDNSHPESRSGGQFLPWVGNQWQPADAIDGRTAGEPYVIGHAFRMAKDDLIGVYEREIEAALDAAFPD